MYRSWLILRGKYYKGLFPNVQTDLHVTGYQRSGNTFATNLLKELFPRLRIATHVHSVATIKEALQRNVPTIVLIREPEEAISSSIVKRNRSMFGINPVRLSLIDYISYYNYVKKHFFSVFILDFSVLVRRPEFLIKSAISVLSEKIEDDMPKPADIRLAVKRVIKELKSDKRPAAQNTWRSSEKEKLKRSAKELLRGDPQFFEACNLYRFIKNADQRSNGMQF